MVLTKELGPGAGVKAGAGGLCCETEAVISEYELVKNPHMARVKVRLTGTGTGMAKSTILVLTMSTIRTSLCRQYNS
jgi:hypothetical protein